MSTSSRSSSSTLADSTDRPPKVRPDPVTKPAPNPAIQDPFASLPAAFDAERFQPPAWAREMGHMGLDSPGREDRLVESSNSGRERKEAGTGGRGGNDEGEGDDVETESLGLSEQDEVWEDAQEELEGMIDESTGEFTLAELRRLFEKATTLKTEGNAHFTAKPSRHDRAVEAYQNALGCLPKRDPKPDVVKEDGPSQTETAEASSSKSATTAPPAPPLGSSGIQELSEAEAAALEAELKRTTAAEAGEDAEEGEKKAKTEEEEKDEVYEEIRQLRKVCYGNLAAVYLAQEGKENECVEVCTEALKIDPMYLKGLQRRATANERLGTWSSLTSAQEDYTTLLPLLPISSRPALRRTLSTLPARIKQRQDTEKDEMLSKLKDLGNGLLGKFGLSTDMFKFDPQEGGGYSMRFER
ncbi:uncharacterized protein MKK02DRAFT_44423 [Dioszegia hungarica]|uniref:TPR-like protein n=1 Tax=Dioszegia hungarica TaxID=4972 RepID=A0AA38HB21_9TREE|nr:uncharacterized protein MKK02DRAFT_44423 [Dioszegia hungarica]KAI9635724.1 hypothetical protein MKK02DRAFT_44423 [Dioszegia hungarica]